MRKGDKYFIIILAIWIGLYILGWVQEWAGVYEFGLGVSTFFIGSLFWIGAPYLIYRIFRYRKDNNKKQIKNENSTSLEILKERYAKGEITKEEFDKIKEDLG